ELGPRIHRPAIDPRLADRPELSDWRGSLRTNPWRRVPSVCSWTWPYRNLLDQGNREPREAEYRRVYACGLLNRWRHWLRRGTFWQLRIVLCSSTAANTERASKRSFIMSPRCLFDSIGTSTSPSANHSNLSVRDVWQCGDFSWRSTTTWPKQKASAKLSGSGLKAMMRRPPLAKHRQVKAPVCAPTSTTTSEGESAERLY